MAKRSHKYRPAPRESASAFSTSRLHRLQDDLNGLKCIAKDLRGPVGALRSNAETADDRCFAASGALRTVKDHLTPMAVSFREFETQIRVLIDDCVSLILTNVASRARLAEEALFKALGHLEHQKDDLGNVTGGASWVMEGLLTIEADLGGMVSELLREVASAPGGTANPFPGRAQKRRDPAKR